MTRDARDRPERVGEKLVPARRERREELAPRVAIGAEPRRGRLDRALHDDRGAVVERMGERRVGMRPMQPVLREREAVEEGEAAAMGWKAEQTSWTKPGRV